MMRFGLKYLRYPCLLFFVLVQCSSPSAQISAQTSAQIQITDSHGKYTFDQPPERVVILNWALAEQVIELGVTPVGMADVAGFRQHASKPAVPSTVVSVGDRLSPNLKSIKQLQPDIIMIGYSQRSLIRPLSNIATVIYFKNFGSRYNNYQKSRERFTELAKLFDKTALAQEQLRALDHTLTTLKESLSKAYDESSMALPMIQFTVHNGSDVWLFGENSMPHHAASQLGLDVLSAKENNKFGIAMLNRTDYLLLLDAKKAHISHADDSILASSREVVCEMRLSSYSISNVSTNESSPKSCGADLAYQNAFGGVNSIKYLAHAIHDILLSALAH